MDTQKIETIMKQVEDLSPEELRETFRRIKTKIKESRQGKVELITEPINLDAFRKLTLIIQGHQYHMEPDKPGAYEYFLIDEETNKGKKVASERMVGQTANRAMILGIIHAITKISKEKKCHITVVSKGSWGYASINKHKKGINGDLLVQLQALVNERGDFIEATLDAEMVDQYMKQ